MKITLLPLFGLIVSAFALPSLAQRPEGREREEHGERGRLEGMGRSGGMRLSPIVAALDTDKDGTLSAEEIAKASEALKTLDKNADGKLSPEELRPAGGPGGEGGSRFGNPEEMVNRLMEMDKNKDGKLTKEELPERMAGMIARGDADKDGALSKEEIQKLAASGPGGRGGEGERRERGGERREGSEGAPPPAK